MSLSLRLFSKVILLNYFSIWLGYRVLAVGSYDYLNHVVLIVEANYKEVLLKVRRFLNFDFSLH